ncbi:MAG: barstar family protein [Anaerovoracaceae bacterium]|jgi:RNAse (barnase) inhibitor barstar
MACIVLDANRLTDRETAHSYLEYILHFPPHYGRNLDALYDLLTEISEPTNIVLVRRFCGDPSENPLRESILKTVEEACRDNDRLTLSIL